MFEDSLIALDKKRNSRGVRSRIIVAAIILHAVAAGGILFAQYWQVPPVEEPPINVVFLNAAPPPPPPPPPPAAPKPVVKQVQIARPTEPVQPVVIPEKLPEPKPAEPAPDAGVVGGVEGGVPGGVAGGIPGGVPGGVVGGVVDEAPLRVGGAVTKPEKISAPPPVYTEMARKARLQGVVIIEAIIDAEGNVINAHVLKGMPMGLDQAAKDAVSKWKFRPATLQGKPVKVYYTLTVNFQVQ